MMSFILTAAILLGLCLIGDFQGVVADDANKDPHMAPGHSTIVQMFEWRWDDLASECENFLGPYGYGGIQVSPANENVVVMNPMRPWYERYQPVSYILGTRSGSPDDFKDMVNRCNKANVRVYVDVVVNHMTASDAGEGYGTSGSHYDANTQTFDAVGYDASHFHMCSSCPWNCQIANYDDPNEARTCRLLGLLDLDQSNLFVQGKIVDYLNNHVDLGVAGFRMDATKHMFPQQVQAIIDQVKPLRSDIFGENAKPFVYQEVADYGNQQIKYSDYTGIGRVTEFKYGLYLTELFRKEKSLRYLVNWGEGWDMMDRSDAVVFVDNHDRQRDVAGNNCPVLTFFEPKLYKMATAFMLAHPYGVPRIMSSFWWPKTIIYNQDINSWFGPPHDDQYNILHVTYAEDLSCMNGRICEHRWRQIYNMLRFRNAANGTDIANWWSTGENQIAIGRGDRAFLVINGETFDLDETLQTGMATGVYCDVISGDLQDGKCTGRTVVVYNDGTAIFQICAGAEDPMMAIHVDAKLSNL